MKKETSANEMNLPPGWKLYGFSLKDEFRNSSDDKRAVLNEALWDVGIGVMWVEGEAIPDELLIPSPTDIPEELGKFKIRQINRR